MDDNAFNSESADQLVPVIRCVCVGGGGPKGFCSKFDTLACNFIFVPCYSKNYFMNEMWHFIYVLSLILFIYLYFCRGALYN